MLGKDEPKSALHDHKLPMDEQSVAKIVEAVDANKDDAIQLDFLQLPAISGNSQRFPTIPSDS